MSTESTKSPTPALALAPSSAPTYAHEWTIIVKADTLQGAMNAVWNCWDAWHRGNEPIGGTCPERMGERMTYDVIKTKKPALPNVQAEPRSP